MKGFILAALFSLAYAGTVLAFFRASLPEFRAALMMRVYLVSLPLLVLAMVATPADLGFLPAVLVERNAWLDGAFGFFAYSASVFGGWLQLYNLADRGLSLRILIDAAEGVVVVTPAHLASAYGQGKGIRWMYEKRLADLERLQLVRREGESLAITEKGLRNAALILWLRRLYSIAPAEAGPR